MPIGSSLLVPARLRAPPAHSAPPRPQGSLHSTVASGKVLDATTGQAVGVFDFLATATRPSAPPTNPSWAALVTMTLELGAAGEHTLVLGGSVEATGGGMQSVFTDISDLAVTGGTGQ